VRDFLGILDPRGGRRIEHYRELLPEIEADPLTCANAAKAR
jgi:hypothetical protein